MLPILSKSIPVGKPAAEPNPVDKARTLVVDINNMIKLIRRQPGEDIDPALRKMLQGPLAELCQMVILNSHSKLYELVFVAQNPELDASVCEDTHGADLRDKDGGHHEHKVSICLKTKGSVNFNFSLPPGNGDTPERRAALLKNIRTKTENGTLILEIKSPKGVLIDKFVFPGGFVYEYFSRIYLGRCNNHNMGCVRCADCGKFHRLEKLRDMAAIWVVHGNVAEDIWKEAMGRTKANCGKKPAA